MVRLQVIDDEVVFLKLDQIFLTLLCYISYSLHSCFHILYEIIILWKCYEIRCLVAFSNLSLFHLVDLPIAPVHRWRLVSRGSLPFVARPRLLLLLLIRFLRSCFAEMAAWRSTLCAGTPTLTFYQSFVLGPLAWKTVFL